MANTKVYERIISVMEMSFLEDFIEAHENDMFKTCYQNHNACSNYLFDKYLTTKCKLIYYKHKPSKSLLISHAIKNNNFKIANYLLGYRTDDPMSFLNHYPEYKKEILIALGKCSDIKFLKYFMSVNEDMFQEIAKYSVQYHNFNVSKYFIFNYPFLQNEMLILSILHMDLDLFLYLININVNMYFANLIDFAISMIKNFGNHKHCLKILFVILQYKYELNQEFIYLCIKLCDIRIIQRIVDNVIAYDQKSIFTGYVTDEICKCPNIEIVKYIYNKIGIIPEIVSLATNSNPDVIKFLIKDCDLKTPIFSVNETSSEIYHTLYEHGVDLVSLHYVLGVYSRHNNFQYAKQLIEKENIKPKESVLIDFINFNNHEAVEYLLPHYSNFNFLQLYHETKLLGYLLRVLNIGAEYLINYNHPDIPTKLIDNIMEGDHKHLFCEKFIASLEFLDQNFMKYMINTYLPDIKEYIDKIDLSLALVNEIYNMCEVTNLHNVVNIKNLSDSFDWCFMINTGYNIFLLTEENIQSLLEDYTE